MRVETTDGDIKLVEHFPDDGLWAVRWDMRPKPNQEGVYSFEEERFPYIPTIGDVQRVISEWYNKQTNEAIIHGYEWKKRKVLLNDENKFNYKAIIDEAARRESAIKIWDEQNPDMAGVSHTYRDMTLPDGRVVQFEDATGRPISLLPVTLKLGAENIPENFYVFKTLEELQEFFSSGVQYLITAYARGWTQIATFDYTPYEEALANLNIE